TVIVNQLPTVSVTTPSGTQSGPVAINYSLADAESETCSIKAEYSTNGGSTWSPAMRGSNSDATTSLGSSPGGTSHIFVWASVTDLPNASNTSVRFRITPSDAGGQGTAGITAPRSVNIPVIVNQLPT